MTTHLSQRLTILDELAELVRKSAEGHLTQVMGGPLSLTGFWLVHSFPYRSPPEYMRYGYVSLHSLPFVRLT